MIFTPHNTSRERERERTEDKEDEEEEDESSSAEELFFSYASFLLSFLYSFFGVFVVERGLC